MIGLGLEFSFLSLLLLINIVLAVIVMIWERRKPTSTIAWILVMLIIPLGGFVLYLLVGRNLAHRHIFPVSDEERLQLVKWVRRQGQFLRKDHLDVSDPMVYRHRDMIHMNLLSAYAVYARDNEVEVVTRGKEKFNRLFSSMRKARRQIHIEYYIVKNDILGNRLIDLLIDKAKEGLEIRFLVDFLGSRIPPKRLREMQEAGVMVSRFFPARLFPIPEVMLNNRNHRKIVVIDGELAFMGGFNIGEEYLGLKESLGYWRDTHLIIRGSAVLELQNRFVLDWRASGAEWRDWGELVFPRTDGTGKVGMQVVSSGPDSQMEQIKFSYLAMIHSAEHSIYIQTPYFIPDESMFDALQIVTISLISRREAVGTAITISSMSCSRATLFTLHLSPKMVTP